jgi:hypothetical protein
VIEDKIVGYVRRDSDGGETEYYVILRNDSICYRAESKAKRMTCKIELDRATEVVRQRIAALYSDEAVVQRIPFVREVAK